MASNIWLISGGTNYYISGGGASQTVYAGSGTPWTAQSTTPYELAMNDVSGQAWTPQASTRQEVYGGGPPFRNGQSLIYDSYGNVVETLVIQCRATTHDNAVFLKQQLHRILNTSRFTVPCVLAAQPDGATNIVYYDIYGADIQEDARFINEEAGVVSAGRGLLRAVVSWRRSPHGTLITAGETVLNALTFTNTGTGANNNTQAFSAASGDLIHEGQPMNVSIQPANVASIWVRRTYLGSVLSRTYSTTGAAALSTSSTTEVDLATLASWTMTSRLTNAGIRPRVMLRFSTAPSANLLMRLKVIVSDSLYNNYYTPWVSATEPDLVDQHKLVDMGTFPIDILRRNGTVTTPSVNIILTGRSTNGSSATATLGYSEYIFYYDWCRIDTLNAYAADGVDILFIDQFQEASGVPCTPWAAGEAIVYESASNMNIRGDVRGRLPRYYSGASLYLAWVNEDGDHTTTDTATVSARVSPQWTSLRGGD